MNELDILNKEHCDFNLSDFIPVGHRVNPNEKKICLQNEDGTSCELKGYKYVMTRENYEDFRESRRRNEEFIVELIEVCINNGKFSLCDNKIECNSSDISLIWSVNN